jgi:hypothetical protein
VSNQFFNWLERRIGEYEQARQRGLKAYKTRWKKVLAEANDDIEPTESTHGLHAPFDGYVHTWAKGDSDFEATYLAGQFLPWSSEHETMSDGAFTDDHRIQHVPVARAEKFMTGFAELSEEARATVTAYTGRPYEDRKTGEQLMYVYVTKCPADLCRAIEDYLMGDLYKLQRLAEEKSEEERDARDAAHQNGEDTPEGRVEITGSILCFKWQASDWGDVLKMLVQDDRGFRVWGTCPKSLDDAERDSRIAFTATITRSDSDSKFGFFKRPCKSLILQ